MRCKARSYEADDIRHAAMLLEMFNASVDLISVVTSATAFSTKVGTLSRLSSL